MVVGTYAPPTPFSRESSMRPISLASDTPTEEDDGYLPSSEIAALKLDADLVILSACNTSAGAATSAVAAL